MTPLPGVILRAQAAEDVRSIITYLAQNSTERAIRFAKSAQETIEHLVESPFIGSSRDLSDIDPQLHSLKVWPVGNFKQYLIFYRPFVSGNGIEVWAVLHSSRDYASHLQESLES